MSTRMQWELGTVTRLFVQGSHPRPGVKAEIVGENGKVYLLRDGSYAPENTSRAVRPGDRVRFEDRNGYPMDLRRVDA